MENVYGIGQVWSYQTREGEEDSFLVIVATEEHEKVGAIVNIYVGGLRMRNSRAASGITEVISHLPFAKNAIDECVGDLLGYADSLPPYEEGYGSWRQAFDSGDAGVFTIPVAMVIEAMEKTMEM